MNTEQRIPVTKKQAELIEWALGPMPDFWCTCEGARERGNLDTGEDGRVYQERRLPRLDGGSLILSPAAEINSDLHYRIAEQAEQMLSRTSESPRAVAGIQRTIDALRDKLEAAGVKEWHELDETEAA